MCAQLMLAPYFIIFFIFDVLATGSKYRKMITSLTLFCLF